MRQLAPSKPLDPGGEARSDPSTSPDENVDARTDGRVKDTRTRHACEACRLLKVRCLSNTNTSSQKCLRCARLNQECFMKPRAPRKPRKRTDTRVGELERQVEMLTAALGNSTDRRKSMLPSTKPEDPPPLTRSQEHTLIPEATKTLTKARASPTFPYATLQLPLPPCGTTGGSVPQRTDSPPARTSSEGLVSSNSSALFERYKTELIQHIPLNLFLDTDDALTVQERDPTLFLAVITAAAGDSDLELHSTLCDQLRQVLGKRTVVDGEKSLELVQSLLVAAAFCQRPDSCEKLKYYQYIHMASAMSSELGLGSFDSPVEPRECREYLASYRDQELERNASRRTAIACYLSCLSVARSARRSYLSQSDNTTERCVEALKNSPYVTPLDLQLIAWAKLECIMKEATQLLGIAEPDITADAADLRTQCTMKSFETRLEKWEKELPLGIMSPTLEITYHYSKMYLHEIALDSEGSAEDLRPPFRLRPPSKASYTLPDLHAARLDSVIASLNSAHSLLDIFIRQSPRTLRVLPTLLYIRVSYAIVVLMKISFISSAPGSELGQVLPPDSVKVEEYLDRLILRLQLAANGGNSRLTMVFNSCYIRAREWFRRQTLRTDWEKGIGEKDLLEPFRLLTVNDELDPSQAQCPGDMPALHECGTEQTKYFQSNDKSSIDRCETTPESQTTATETDQLGEGVVTSRTWTWQQPMPWNSQTSPLESPHAEQAILEPQAVSSLMEDQTQIHIPLWDMDNMVDDSLDLTKGIDFDWQFWDFEMGDISSEYN